MRKTRSTSSNKNKNQSQSQSQIKLKKKKIDRQEIQVSEIQNETNSSIDSEDDENKVRVGRVPTTWYEDLKHVGYDINAKQIEKQKQSDQISKLIEQEENDNWWRTVHDELNNENVVLTQEQLEVLERIRKGQIADKTLLEKDYFFEYDSKEGQFPLSGGAPAKKQFQPSKWEKMKVNKLIRAIQLNWIKLDQPKKSEEEKVYDAWEKETSENFGSNLPRIVAPKRKLPGHAESYNPSEEFLYNEEEKQKWAEMDPSDRDLNFIPQKIGTLRKIKAYENIINEQFERCLELYLCPRIIKKKLNINPEDLLPNLPKPQELRPFPTTPNITFEGHKSRIRSISIFHTGQYLASADEKGMLIIWETSTGRICKKLEFEGVNYSIVWSKDPKGGILGLANENQVFLMNFDLLPEVNYQNNCELVEEIKKLISGAQWNSAISIHQTGYNLIVASQDRRVCWFDIELQNTPYKTLRYHQKMIRQVVFHQKYPLFASCSDDGTINIFHATVYDDLSQNPLIVPLKVLKAHEIRNELGVLDIVFHPTQPWIFSSGADHKLILWT